jgi:hypothetical protein
MMTALATIQEPEMIPAPAMTRVRETTRAPAMIPVQGMIQVLETILALAAAQAATTAVMMESMTLYRLRWLVGAVLRRQRWSR